MNHLNFILSVVFSGRSASIQMATSGKPAPMPGTGGTKTITVSEEVWGYIIAFLDRMLDVQTILACTLVSRTWYSIGLSKLFYIIAFRREQSWTHFKAFLSPSAEPRITRYLKTVRELHITPRGPEEESWSREVLVECSRHLTGVRTVFLGSVRWTAEWRPSLYSIPPSSYRSVQLLRINDMKVFDFGDLYRLISTFPAVSQFDLSLFSFSNESQAMSSTRRQELEQLPELHSMKELRITSCASDIVSSLVKFGLVKHLERLFLFWECVVRDEDWATLSKAIDRCSLSFLHFYFHLDDCTTPCTCFHSLTAPAQDGTDPDVNVASI